MRRRCGALVAFCVAGLASGCPAPGPLPADCGACTRELSAGGEYTPVCRVRADGGAPERMVFNFAIDVAGPVSSESSAPTECQPCLGGDAALSPLAVCDAIRRQSEALASCYCRLAHAQDADPSFVMRVRLRVADGAATVEDMSSEPEDAGDDAMDDCIRRTIEDTRFCASSRQTSVEHTLAFQGGRDELCATVPGPDAP